MASYLIANYKVTNQEGYGAYLAAVGPTLADYGGKILVAGAGSDTVEGSPEPITIVLEFSTREALQGWYDSDAYQQIIHFRTDNTEGFLVFADEFVIPS